MSSPPSGSKRVAAVLLVAFATIAGLIVTAAPAYAASAPVISAMSATRGAVAGGTTVVITITGTTFPDDMSGVSVKFGTSDATSVAWISATQITAKSPGSSIEEQVDVYVTTSTGTSSPTTLTKFAYREPIAAVIPSDTLLNPVGGGKLPVTVTTTDVIAKKLTATINGAASTLTYVGVDVDSSKQDVNLAVPVGVPGVTTIPVVLKNDGVSGAPATAQYAVVITSLSVTSGPTIGGNAFTGTCTPSTTPDTQVTCVGIPAHAAGPVTVTFTPNTGMVLGTTATSVYTYTDLR